jgi:hypothetical protein
MIDRSTAPRLNNVKAAHEPGRSIGTGVEMRKRTGQRDAAIVTRARTAHTRVCRRNWLGVGDADTCGRSSPQSNESVDSED